MLDFAAEAATVRELRKAVNSVTALVELWRLGVRASRRTRRPPRAPSLPLAQSNPPSHLLARLRRGCVSAPLAAPE